MIFSLVTIIIFFVFLEFLLKVIFTKAFPRLRMSGTGLEVKVSKEIKFIANLELFEYQADYIQDKRLLWKHRPSSIATSGIKINSDGFRGEEIVKPKPDDICRIICLGDSCTYGLLIKNDKDVYPKVLEAILNEKGIIKKKVEVINAGVSGYSSYQGLQLLKGPIIDLQPDIITIQYGLNDFIWANKYSDKEMRMGSETTRRLSNFLEKFAITRAIKLVICRFQDTNYYVTSNSLQNLKRRVSLEEFKKNLEEIVDIAKKNNIQPFLINIAIRPKLPVVLNPVPEFILVPASSKQGKVNDKYKVIFRYGYMIGDESYWFKSKYEGSIETLKNEVKKNPDFPILHYFLADYYKEQGKIELSEKEFNIASELDTSRKTIIEYNPVIRNVAEEEDVPLVDISDVFDKEDMLKYFIDERHMDTEGNKIVASEIMKIIVQFNAEPNKH